MRPSELTLLRQRVAHFQKIAADQALQANELKAWLIALLKRIGPQELTMQEFLAVGHTQITVDGDGKETRTEPETMFVVEPVKEIEDPANPGAMLPAPDGTVLLTVAKFEPPKGDA